MRQLSLLQSAMDSSYILLQLVLYYKVRHGLLQIATDVTKSYDYYSWRKERFNLNKFLSLSFKGKTYREPAWYNWSHRTNFIHKTHHLCGFNTPIQPKTGSCMKARPKGYLSSESQKSWRKTPTLCMEDMKCLLM